MSAGTHLTERDEAWSRAGLITDPGDGGAIPILKSGLCKLVTTEAGGETRTLADPVEAGIELQLSLMTDGGDCVITVASGFNGSAETTLTFADVGDTAILRSAPISATAYVWRTATLEIGTGAVPS